MNAKIIIHAAIVTSVLIIGAIAVNFSSPQSTDEKEPATNKSPQKLRHNAILRGKVVDKRTSSPLEGYFIMVGDGIAHRTDEHGKFKIEVKPGQYFLHLAEMRAMTSQMARREEAKGRLWSQRTEWKELTGQKTAFRKGNFVTVNAQKGQIRTFVFRFESLDKK